jgi:hypothetical protein
MLLTAAKIAGSYLYRQSRRALAWLTNQIRSRLAERRAARTAPEAKSTAHDEPGD